MRDRAGIGLAVIGIAFATAVGIAQLTGTPLSWWAAGPALAACSGLAGFGVYLLTSDPITAELYDLGDVWAGLWQGRQTLRFEASMMVSRGDRAQIEFFLRLPDGSRIDGSEYQKTLNDPFWNRDGRSLRAGGNIDNPKVFGPGKTGPFKMAFLASKEDLPGGFPRSGLVIEYQETTRQKPLGELHIPELPPPPEPPPVTPELMRLLDIAVSPSASGAGAWSPSPTDFGPAGNGPTVRHLGGRHRGGAWSGGKRQDRRHGRVG